MAITLREWNRSGPPSSGCTSRTSACSRPIIADQLVRALERYPREWIEDAIGEAVAYNRRNWRYIQRILQQWATVTGRGESARKAKHDHETHRRRS